MKRTNFDHAYKITLSVRTESGAVAIEVGLQALTRQERKFLHNLVRDTHEGGTVGFGVEPGPNGESVIKLGLSGAVTAPAQTPETVLNGAPS